MLPALRGGPMGASIPPESKSQLASARDDDPHESVTIAPPAPDFEQLLRQPTPLPSLATQSEAHFQAALEAGSRAGSSLGELSRIVAELSGGLSGAKNANEQLVQELSTLRTMLGAANEQHVTLRGRIAELEEDIITLKGEAARERQFLTDQHDEFLTALLEEHEEALREQQLDGETTRMGADVAGLAQQLVQVESARQKAETEASRACGALNEAEQQRDDALARARKIERERDELRAEASQLRAQLGAHRSSSSTTPPPPVTHSRPPSFAAPPALQLDDGELDSTLHARSSATPRVPSVVPRFSPAPPPVAPRSSPRAAAPNPPTASAFPRESTRPGVGGPKPSEPPPPSFGPPPSGWTPPSPASQSKPPPSGRVTSAANLPQGLTASSPLKQKPDPTTRPLIDYSLGKDGVQSELLEGARLSSKPPKK